MDAIRIKNLRALEDTGLIDLKPITFLLGANSSGKSTFLRSLPLIRQSVTAKTTSPILWYGDLVDFGSFAEALNNKSNIEEICFAYKFRISSSPSSYTMQRLFYSMVRVIEDLDVSIEIRMARDDSQYSTTCKGLTIEIADHTIEIEIDRSGSLTKFDVNNTNFLKSEVHFKSIQEGGLLPRIFKVKGNYKEIDPSFYTATFNTRSFFFTEELVELTKKIAHHKTSSYNVAALAQSLIIGSSSAILANIKNNDSLSKKSANWTKNDSSFIEIKNFIVANKIPALLSFCDIYMADFARNISYMGPVRATAERYYRSQGLAVSEVDSEGKNLAMFLRNLTEHERMEFSKWTKKYFNFSVIIHSSVEHVSLKLKESDLEDEINLADTGFGFSQILPILTQLWWLGKERVEKREDLFSLNQIFFAIEQPELHLHPKLQALLADFFIASVNTAKESGLDLRLIIETHSETIINRVGNRIASGECDATDINVVVFEKNKSSDPVKIVTASYDQEGFLTNWPLGFFEPNMI